MEGELAELNEMGKAARTASRTLANLDSRTKNSALGAIADAIVAGASAILAQNALDMADAEARGQSPALLDRLMLNERRLADLAHDVRQVIALPDPVGVEFDGRVLPNGIRLSKRRIPIGVIGVIYEARPNVTLDITSLCLKTGNATILRGGTETLRSNLAIVAVVQQALAQCGLPAAAVQYIANPDRALVTGLLRLDRYVDMIVPRGGAGLHRLCREQASVPVITGGMGICHIFVDASADQEKALAIIENAKVQRPSVCNALDTVLVHEEIAAQFLPALSRRMAANKVTLHPAGTALPFVAGVSGGAVVVPAVEADFDREWMSLDLGIRLVTGVSEAIAHVQEHSLDHSDSILTEDLRSAQQFVDQVNSSAVYVNASTRFTDGGQFGLGAEVAVSTQKLHARGPMGLEELTTYKWIGIGTGQVRE
jgi:glutamate-5-semialdehyde dehydrogenase